MKFVAVNEECYIVLSPPSRGAWIEILWQGQQYLYDRSPPSRGAWIEILVYFISRKK